MATNEKQKSVTMPRELYALIGSAAFIAIGFGIVAPVLPIFANSFNVSTLMISAVVSAFAFFRLIFAPVSGVLVNRTGERLTYIAGLLIVSASMAACAFAQTYWQLLAFRALGGIGSTMFTVAAMGLIVKLAPPEARGRASAMFASAFIVGTLVGPLIGGVLSGFGLRVPFLVYSVGLVIAAAVVAVFIRQDGGHAANGNGKQDELTFRNALGLAPYRAAIASSFFNGWATFGVRMAIVPLFIVAIVGVESGPMRASIVMTGFAVGNVVSVRFSGSFSDRIGRKPLIMAGLLTGGLATVVFGVTDNYYIILALSVVAGAGTGLFYSPMQAVVADLIGSNRRGGNVIAGYQMAQDTGGIIGPLAAGLMVDSLGYGWTFAITGVFLLMGAGTWIRTPETHQQSDS